MLWGYSSAGRAPALHAGGQEFDPPRLHHFYWSGSSVGLECRPVTAEVAGSSPVQTANWFRSSVGRAED